MRAEAGPLPWVLASNLRLMFGENVKLHLDHDPPLRVRAYNPKIKDIAARYFPNANDPEYLCYLTDTAHRLKTNVRGNGAQYPDRVLITRERRRETPKPKRKHQWGKRKLQSRSTFNRLKSKRQTRKIGFRLAAHIRPQR